MATLDKKYDVVVIGAGSAGAAAALQLARAGRSVALVEKLSLAGAGARWINGIPPWMFEEAALARPRDEELRGADHEMIILGPAGGRQEPGVSPIWDVYMDRLVARLQREAVEAGAETYEGARLGELVAPGDRPEALEVTVGEQRQRLWAQLFVDASGRAGALKNRLARLSADWPVVPREHLCTAHQSTHKIADPAGARAFLDRREAVPGQVITHTGVEGGWSIINVQVHANLRTVDLLAGCIDDGEHPSGAQMLAGFRDPRPWIGQQISGGGGQIPLRRPYDRLVAPGVALIGDAACMVFPLHGSGVGASLIAAKLLAEAVGAVADPGDFAALWQYQKAFQRQVGAVNAAYDVLRRTVAGLGPNEVDQLMTSGLLSRSMIRAGLDQRLPGPAAMSLASLPGAILRAPALAARLTGVLARMGAVYSAYKAFPPKPSEWALRSFSQAVATLMGDKPDLTGAPPA